jgi:hypothetical protein
MWIMFDAISVTNETSFVPSTDGGECECVDAVAGLDNIEGQEEEQPPSPQMLNPVLKKGQLPLPPRERRRLLEISVWIV